MKTGRFYSPEFKEESVRLVQSSEKHPVPKIARKFIDGISRRSLRPIVRGTSWLYEAMGVEPLPEAIYLVEYLLVQLVTKRLPV